MSLSPPARIGGHHRLDGFESDEPALDDWLRRRALENDRRGASRVFVLCEGDLVVGYYALAAGAISLAQAPGNLRRNMPDPIPMAVLGRLAVARSHAGQGLGRALVRDAGGRVMAAAESIAVRGLLVHAISAPARAFYLHVGFAPSPIDPMTLMISLEALRRALGS